MKVHVSRQEKEQQRSLRKWLVTRVSAAKKRRKIATAARVKPVRVTIAVFAEAHSRKGNFGCNAILAKNGIMLIAPTNKRRRRKNLRNFHRGNVKCANKTDL